MKFDAIIIGSGFGGAVSAARLSEQGMKVLVLERGPWWGPGGEDQPRSERRPLPRGPWGVRKAVRNVRWARKGRARDFVLNRDGLVEWHAFQKANVFGASGVGGTSVIYGAVTEQPDDGYFDFFPEEISAGDMSTFYDRVRGMLKPVSIPDYKKQTAYFEKVLQSDTVKAQSLGPSKGIESAIVYGANPDIPEQHVNAAGVTQSSCVYCGNCMFGCQDKAKSSLDFTYLPLAIQHGAIIQPLSEVITIEKGNDNYTVHYVDHRTKTKGRVSARRVIVSAGSLNTVRLLSAAKYQYTTLTQLPEGLGKNFSTNADHLDFAYGLPDIPERENIGTGGAQAMYKVGGRHRYLVGEVGKLPVPGIFNRWLGSVFGLVGIGAESETGVLEFDGYGLKSRISQSVDRELYSQMQVTMQALVDGLGAKGAQKALLALGTGKDGIGSVHPLGGASIATTPDHGVVGHNGEVFGYPNLYIADGSLFPRAPGLPPSMTIAALAERQAGLMSE